PHECHTLSAVNTLSDEDGLGSFSYSWQAFNGTSWSEVGTASTFTPEQAQVGQPIRVTVTYTDGFGHAETVTSAQTAAVANVNDAPQGGVAISDTTPEEGQSLSVVNTLS